MYQTLEEIEQLVRNFEDKSLSKDCWTHEAHLVVGLYYAFLYPLDEVITKMREGILLFNEAKGGQNTDTSGYHETVTIAWSTVLTEYARKKVKQEVSVEPFNDFLASPMAERNYLLRFYSKEHLMSIAARKHWVEPDLQPLPHADNT